MSTEIGGGSESPDRELRRLADLLDVASQETSQYEMALAVRSGLGLSAVEDLSPDLPLRERAAAWAFDYQVELTDADGRRRVRLAPGFEHDDGSEPPAVRDVSSDVAEVWRDLLGLVEGEPVRARLHHLLFEHRAAEAFDHARLGARAYLASAGGRERALDAVQDLAVATRLGRAVKDDIVVGESLERMADLVEQQLSSAKPLAGVVQRALRHLVGEPWRPDRVDDLLERAASAWPDANRQDAVLAVMLLHCRNDGARLALWRRRVTAYLQEAEVAPSKILRAVRLQQALERAESSGDPGLRQEAAGALQTVRDDDLELMSFSATSRRYEEEFERLVAQASDGDDWQRALITFARSGPLSGDSADNRMLIQQRHHMFPLASLFPTQILDPDGLPAYSGIDEEDRFDVDLAKWEAELIAAHARVMAAALHQIPSRHGLPTLNEISEFLNQWPAVHGALAPAMARALLRFWAGDSEAAAYTIVPRIETLARHLVLRTERGIYRLQREHVPGQYAGLGRLLPILQEDYGVDESQVRFLSALLRHPAGLNLRNLMLHGFMDDPGPEFAAVLLHAALSLALLAPTTPAAADPSP